MEQTWLQYFNPPKLFCFLDKSCTKYFVTDKKYGRFGLCLQNHGNVILKESFIEFPNDLLKSLFLSNFVTDVSFSVKVDWADVRRLKSSALEDIFEPNPQFVIMRASKSMVNYNGVRIVDKELTCVKWILENQMPKD